MPGLWIYGPVPPEPKGGVTSFMRRLLADERLSIDGIVDPYFGAKQKIAPMHHFPSRAGLIARLAITQKLSNLSDAPLLINVSTIGALARLYPFFRRRTASTSLILHHGNLEFAGLATRLFARRALDKVDRIFCLSELQLDQLETFGVDRRKLVLVDPYLAPAKPSIEATKEASDIRTWMNQDDCPVLLGSGFAMDYYRHEWALRALQDDPRFAGCRLLVCCYGPQTELLKKLEKRFADEPRARLTFDIDEDVFIDILQHASIYVRPTAVDSFGIALHDADYFGLKIVASDARERPAGSFVHSVDDELGFRDALFQAISNMGRRASIDVDDQMRRPTPLVEAILSWLNSSEGSLARR